jgi:hypothetical protein
MILIISPEFMNKTIEMAGRKNNTMICKELKTIRHVCVKRTVAIILMRENDIVDEGN